MANIELDSSDSGGSDFAGFNDEDIHRSISETTMRVIGTARAAVGVTESDSVSSDSDATIVVNNGTVITRI